jgi:signal transduction histidine kinase
MSVEALILVSCGAAIAALSLLILLRNPKGNTNQLFAILGLSLIGWTTFNYLSDVTLAVNTGLIYTRLTFFWGVVAIFSLITFITYFPHKALFRKNFLYKVHILWSAALLPLTLTPVFISSVVSVPTPEIHTTTFYPVFIAYVLYSLTLLPIIVFKQYKNTTLISQKQQLALLAWGIAIYSFLAVTSSVIIPLLSNSWSSSKFGPISTLVLVGFFAFAIVKHKLFDIRLVVARSVAYSLLLFVLGALYSLGAIALGSFLFGNSTSSFSQQVYDVVLALILVFTFQPLKQFFQKFTDKIFFRGGYDANVLLGNLGTIMAREIELEKLTSDVINELTSQMKLLKAVIIVLDNNEVFYEANAISNKHRTIDRAELETIGEGVVIREALDSGIVKEIFIKYDLDICVDLRSTNELNGYLLLGSKKSGDIYNQTDIKTLSILAHELAIALHNAKSYKQIQDFNKTLQKRIDEATEQLRDANEHLKELDQLKNEFLSMATHQLNTPLTVVDGYLTLINDGVVSEPDERKDYLEKTLERVRSMKRMVADFLNVSRIEAGKFIIDVKPTDINKMISEEVNGLGPSAKEKAVLLQFIPPKHPVPLVEIDEQKTRQAAMNLIDNAIYYTPKGEVKVFLDSDQDHVTFKVVDNGIGVPEKQKEQLFQKFFRADNARNERPNGNGVGLYLVKRVIEDQGGKIIFESSEGKGSTFGFTLPIKATITQETKTPEQKEVAEIAN